MCTLLIPNFLSRSVAKTAWWLAAFDSEHDENLTLTTTKKKKLKITNYPRFAIT